MTEEVESLSCLTFSRKQTSPKTTSAQISNLSSWRTKCSNWCDSLTCCEEKDSISIVWIWFINRKDLLLNLFSQFPPLICDNIHMLPSVYVNLQPAYDFQRPYWPLTILAAQSILGSTGLFLRETFWHSSVIFMIPY